MLQHIRLVTLSLLAVLFSTAGCTGSPEGATGKENQERPSIAKLLSGGNTAGYARAYGPRAFSFPADHGPHPQYRQEWWYFTGNLATLQGRRFGFQLTFFRIALAPAPVARDSDWATNQAYMAHFTISDIAAGRFHTFERFSRAALKLAGASARPFRVWLEDWSAEGMGENGLPLHLQAAQDAVAIDLTLGSLKPPILQGEQGLSRKGPAPGNASYYYSLTRMPTRGTIRVGSETFKVEGLSWMDREWSTSALGEGQVGWDWFSLQLSDGREVMFYQLRQRDGSTDPFSGGTLVRTDGSSRSLGPDDVELRVLAHWRSPGTGVRYPSRWAFRIPDEGLELEVAPYLAGQELDLSVRYWEGAVQAQGNAHGRPVTGSGYLELTGYE